MKLRNKRTGEIKEFSLFDGNELQGGATLESLTKEWEDCKEPKPWWYIDITLDVKQGELFLSKHVEQFKTVGNYFETREEAEKAVEKLKAVKRLKDKGFRFTGVEDAERTIHFDIPFRAGYGSCEAEVNLDFLFGGEE